MILIIYMGIIVGSEKEVFMVKILALDPSGTGTTGLCLIENDHYLFTEFQHKDWKKHFQFIQEWTPGVSLLLYENTHFLKEKTQDSLSLFRLLGTIESLPIRKKDQLVSQVKELKKQVFKGTKQIPNLTYKLGRGWIFKQTKISLHCLDAFLVYCLWKGGSHA